VALRALATRAAYWVRLSFDLDMIGDLTQRGGVFGIGSRAAPAGCLADGLFVL
jgi:hypothetical protein